MKARPGAHRGRAPGHHFGGTSASCAGRSNSSSSPRSSRSSSWLVANVRSNSEEIGIPTGYGYLDNPAQFPIPDSSFRQTQPVRDAIVVGLINTLRVTIVGIIAASILGTLVGIGRLSGNWLVRNLARVYVETLRNIPLLLIIVFAYLGLALTAFPRIEDAWQPFDLAVISNRGVVVPSLDGSAWALVLGIAIACGAGWLVARWRRSIADRSGRNAHILLWTLATGVAIVLVTWFAADYALDIPELEGRIVTGGIRLSPEYFAILFALVIYTASHIAEIVRGSIQAVHRGQAEAAASLGLSSAQRLRLVVPAAGVSHRGPASRQPVPEPREEQHPRCGRELLRTRTGHVDQRRQRRARSTVVSAHAHDFPRAFADPLRAGESCESPLGAGRTMTATRWLRHNLFRGPVDSVVTVLVTFATGYLLWRAVQFVFVTGRWEIIEVNLKLLMVGRYPDVHLPRVGISLVIASTVGGLLAGVVHRRQADAGTATRTSVARPRRPVLAGRDRDRDAARAEFVGRSVAGCGWFDRRRGRRPLLGRGASTRVPPPHRRRRADHAVRAGLLSRRRAGLERVGRHHGQRLHRDRGDDPELPPRCVRRARPAIQAARDPRHQHRLHRTVPRRTALRAVAHGRCRAAALRPRGTGARARHPGDRRLHALHRRVHGRDRPRRPPVGAPQPGGSGAVVGAVARTDHVL